MARKSPMAFQARIPKRLCPRVSAARRWAISGTRLSSRVVATNARAVQGPEQSSPQRSSRRARYDASIKVCGPKFPRGVAQEPSAAGHVAAVCSLRKIHVAPGKLAGLPRRFAKCGKRRYRNLPPHTVRPSRLLAALAPVWFSAEPVVAPQGATLDQLTSVAPQRSQQFRRRTD